jgi:hypothetical protein
MSQSRNRFVLLLALLLPTLVFSEDVFHPFKSSDPQLEQLQKLVKEKELSPDNYLAFGEEQYLVSVSEPDMFKVGIHFVDIKRKHVERVAPGLWEVKRIVSHNGRPIWLLLSSVGLYRGVMSIGYYAIVLYLPNKEAATPKWIELLTTKEDGEAGLCGGPVRAKSIGLNTAMTVNSYSIADISGDGIDDLTIEITEENCPDGTKSNKTKKYKYSDNDLKQQP